MAEPKRCKECNCTFQYVNSEQLCFSCSQKNDSEFRRIKEFLKDNPKSSVSMVATSLDISVSHIQKFIDEGRLEIIDK